MPKVKFIEYTEYRSCEDKECHRFGSDLNKFINKECLHKMTACNIDLVLYDQRTKTIRFIESKHEQEKDSIYAENVFRILSMLFSQIKSEYKLEMYKIKADPPYMQAFIYNYQTDETKIVLKHRLQQFLQFDLNFSEI